MSDNKVEIDIKTTADTAGAKEATKSISQLENEIKQAKQELKALKASGEGLDTVKDKAKSAEAELNKMQKQVGKLGTRGGNSGMAVLELSRGLEDLQYGVRGILNNIPSLVLQLGGSAGLAGVISIVAVAGSQLWSAMSQGSEDAKKNAVDWGDVFKKIADEFGNASLNIEKARGESIQRNAANQKAADAESQRAAAAAQKLEQQRIKNDGSVALAKLRLELLEKERDLSASIGDAAVKLAREREQIIKNIVAMEERTVELGREAEARAAKSKVDAAQENLNKSTGTATYAEESRDYAARNKSELQDRLANVMEEQTKTIRSFEKLRDEATAKSKTSLLPGDILGFQGVATDMQKKIDDLVKNSDEFTEGIKSKLKQADATSEEASKNFAEASQKQNDAADALKAAALNYETLLASQGQDRATESQLKTIRQKTSLIEKTKTDESATVEGIGKLVGSVGGGGSKELQAAMRALKTMASDNVLNADELVEANKLLAQFGNQISRLGQEQIAALRDANAKIDELIRDVSNLKSNAKNPPK